MPNFAEMIAELTRSLMKQHNQRLERKTKHVLTESITFYEGMVDKLRRMNAAVEAEDYHAAKVIHDTLIADHNRAITIVSGPGWEDVRVSVIRSSLVAGDHIELPDDEFVFRRTEAPEESEAPTLNELQAPTEPAPPLNETYSVARVDTLFGDDGWGLYANAELVAVIKGLARAELLMSMIELSCGAEALAEWTQVFQAELDKDNDHERASKVADEVFARRMIENAN